MKKKVVSGSFVLLFLLAFFGLQGPSWAAEWTFLVYVDGDNNLEGAGVNDIKQMESVGSTSAVNVVVQFDRIAGYDTSNGNWTDTRRGKIIKDPGIQIASPLVSVGEKNMGDPTTLREFVTWGMATFPASHYFLVLWNHGDGWHSRVSRLQQELAQVRDRIATLGSSRELQQEAEMLTKKIGQASKAVCWDDTDGEDSLSLKEVRQALAGLPHALDVIGFDACLMAMVEVAYEIRDVGSIMVASQGLEPEDGWPYDLILTDLVASPSQTAAELSRKVVNDYGNSYGGDETLSAVWLSQLSPLASALNALAATVLSETTDWETIELARSAAASFYEADFRDLQGFLDSLIQSGSTASLRNAASQARTALLAAVLENYRGSNSGAHGLSIELIGLGGRLPSDYNASTLGFAEATQWDTLLATLSQTQISDDRYEDNDTLPQAAPLGTGEYFSLQCEDDDWFRVTVAPQTPLSATIRFSHGSGDLDMELYDSTYTLIDKSQSIRDIESVYNNKGTSQEYYIHVYGYEGDTNRYDLLLQVPTSDNFYTYEQVPYQWIDATSGTYLEMGDDDYTSIQMGFEFQFYGIRYSGVKISSNGYLTFGYVGDEYSNQPIPVQGEPSNLIAPFWDDLAPSKGGRVYYKVIGTAPSRKLVVEWDDVPHYNTTDGITLEVILNEQTNDIVFQYQDVNLGNPDYDYGQSATVGVENGPGTMGTLYSYKQARLTNREGIRFYPLNVRDVNISEIAIDSASGFSAGQPIRFSAAAINRGASLVYQYWVAPGYGTPQYGTTWDMIRPYASDSTCTWSPSAPDRYVGVVYVNANSGSALVSPSFAGMSIPVDATGSRSHITSLRADISFPQRTTLPITFVAAATGGSLPYYFQFWVSRYEDSIPTWRVIQDFSTSNACRWLPVKAGNYIVIVYVSSTPGISDPYPELAGMTLVVE